MAQEEICKNCQHYDGAVDVSVRGYGKDHGVCRNKSPYRDLKFLPKSNFFIQGDVRYPITGEQDTCNLFRASLK